MSDRPTLYLTNWSSRRHHGPGRKLTIMARPRAWEHGEGAVGILLPDAGALVAVKARRMTADEYFSRFREDLAWATRERGDGGELRGNPLAPGRLSYQPVWSIPKGSVADGDTLLCACAVGAPCHRREAAPFLVRAGWRVILDGVEVDP